MDRLYVLQQGDPVMIILFKVDIGNDDAKLLIGQFVLGMAIAIGYGDIVAFPYEHFLYQPTNTRLIIHHKNLI